jgi:glutamate--cysteine ligase
VPMYFVYRDGNYIDVAGASFRDFLAGRLKGFEGQRPTADDWSDHLTTLFPEVRLKRFLEMRGADGGRWGTITALPAFWTGILYDETALDEAWEMVHDWTADEREALRNDVPKLGFATRFRSMTVRDLARQALRISRLGLKNRGRLNSAKQDETMYLEPLERIAESGQTMSVEFLRRYSSDWDGNIDHIFEEFAF